MNDNKLTNQVIYIVGPPGVGKYTVASELAIQISAQLVDNHYCLNPIFSLIQQDGITPLSDEVWRRVKQIREAVMKTIATLSPPDWNFVFTHAFTGTPQDYEMAEQIFAVADRRSADILVVRLTCSPEELVKRVTMPQRQLRFKEVDPESALRNATLPLIDVCSRKTITIDTSSLNPSATVEQILQALVNE